MANLAMIDRKKSKDFTQINIYIRKELHKQLKIACLEDDLTLSQFIEKLVEEALENRG